MMDFAIDPFFVRAIDDGIYPKTRFDADRQSPCTFGGIDSSGEVKWRPVKRDSLADFTQLEEQTGVLLNVSTKEFYGAYWSAPISCKFGVQFITLDCGAWNDEDFVRKQTMLASHLQCQKEAGLRPTVPIAFTDTDQYVGLDVISHQVFIEEADHTPISIVADSLAAFLADLKCVEPQFALDDD